ncbi:transcription antitermination factor NusB [Paracoccus shanxieyensis]|uniref:Transcription antitermination protein NusB n=1 Tax=Paracoccus shanxieyensis TaxID=2675752 RepID=A0A6L6IT32_9RHOB|nr:transcription antitermination factor NusB [Paracoccus shanxieyensis]MTH63596.1 transcription antitermination factor NusB [Paracoccus shanxieyensis]MTH86517.1 transcription antitermination factor NusB [Paracoccus shanxieyensis]
MSGQGENRRSPEERAERQARTSAARVYAVQALFQMEAASQTADRVMAEFRNWRIGRVDEDPDMVSVEADEKLFTRIINGVVNWQSRIDQMTDRALVAKWPIDRIDPVLRALFRAAGAELVEKGAPPRVVITEYVRICQAFFPDGRESKFVNAVLDHMAHEARPEDF